MPATPPMPITVPTSRRGNTSPTVVTRFADHPWCAAAARPTANTAYHRLWKIDSVAIGSTHTAQTPIAILRATFGLPERAIRRDDSQPPAALPPDAIA